MSFSNSVKKILDNPNVTPKNVIIASIIALTTFCGVKKLIKIYKKNRLIKSKHEEARQIVLERNALIDEFLSQNLDKISQSKADLILSWDATNLLKNIRSKKITVVEAYLTYAIRAATIGKEYNLITDVDFAGGLRKAEEYKKMVDDDNWEKIDEMPLFGLPISVKDQIAVKGMRTTGGIVSLRHHVPDYDALVVEVLRKKGAIPFVHSNVPQGYLSFESSNNIWGVSRNPWNYDKINGASSGGEGGLVAARCSPCGIGSDLGGSIRIPSSFNGIYGFKPTSNKVSKHGGLSYNGLRGNGFLNFASSWGPMCRSADDLILLSRNLFGQFEKDVYINNKPFDEEVMNSIIDNNNYKKKIGYFYETSLVEPADSIIVAMKDIIDKLHVQGYEMIKFPIENFKELLDLGFTLLMNSDAINGLTKTLEGEELAGFYSNLNFLSHQPRWVVSLMSRYYSIIGEKRVAGFLHNFKMLNRPDFIEASRRFAELRSEFITFWKKENYSAIICPVMPLPAFSVGISQEFSNFNAYNFIFNFIDMPAAAIPVDLVTNTKFESKFNDRYSKLFEREIKGSMGLPIGIQIGALPQQDEWVLKLTKDISYYYEFERTHGDEIYDIVNKKMKTLPIKK